jgi:hypothetical protein
MGCNQSTDQKRLQIVSSNPGNNNNIASTAKLQLQPVPVPAHAQRGTVQDGTLYTSLTVNTAPPSPVAPSPSVNNGDVSARVDSTDNNLEQQPNEKWTCGTCGSTENRDQSLYCPRCFALRAQFPSEQHDVAVKTAEMAVIATESLQHWTCLVCTLSSNSARSQFCSLCYSAKDTRSPNTADGNKKEDVESNRWACLVCTVTGNHPWSSHCNTCGQPRDAQPPHEPVAVVPQSSPSSASTPDNESNAPRAPEPRTQSNFSKAAEPPAAPSPLASPNVRPAVLPSPDARSAVTQRPPSISPTPTNPSADTPAVVLSTSPTRQTPPPPPATNNHRDTAAQMERCSVCGEDISTTEKYPIAPDCPPICRCCLASWIESQVNDGNSTKLICPCPQKHKLKYKDLMALRSYFQASKQTFETFNHAQGAAKVDEAQPQSAAVVYRSLTCPDCNTENSVGTQQSSYKCSNPSCAAYGSTICVRHNNRFKAVPNSSGALDFRTLRNKVCSSCFEEAGKDLKVTEVIRAIEDAFCDKCPKCHGYVGGPADFNACMCLMCNLCSSAFCAFCYNYAGTWNDTHKHVRCCPMNPRQNYFVESEETWDNLMKERRRRIGSAIIASAQLNAAQRASAEAYMTRLLN